MTDATQPIALVSRLSESDEALWLSALTAAMPDQSIVSLRQMSEHATHDVRIAIVANPNPADLKRLPKLVWIHSLWAGLERLVAELGDTAPPIVRLVDPELGRVMAESVLAWTYYLARDMPAYARLQRERRWEQRPYRSPANTQVALMGLGALGAAAALRLRDAGFRVSGWSRAAKIIAGVETFAGAGGLAAILAHADILVCLTPLTPETRGLLDRERLSAMRRGAALINFARGPVVVTDDLLSALDSGHLSHAVLDVFDAEPLSAASPLWHHPRVTILPHIAAPTDRDTASRIVAVNIRRYLASGDMPETVDMRRGY